MNTLIFVSISTMLCSIEAFNVGSNTYRRCQFDKEVIVRAQDLKKLTTFKYLLGPISGMEIEGCLVSTVDGELFFSGKPCRNLIGVK